MDFVPADVLILRRLLATCCHMKVQLSRKQMRHLKRAVFAAIVVLIVFTTADESLADRRRGLLWRPFSSRPVRGHYDMYHGNMRYPKYYGGFHARYFQDIGVPPGDVGFRGNGIFSTPW